MNIKKNIIQIDHTFQIFNKYLINNQPDIDKIYLHAKDLYEAKY